jgi:hypothetical protein
MADLPKYESSDAWLLLSVIYASRNHPASLGEILMVGDYINHTSFTQEELDGGFSRLKAREWITGSAAFFSTTEKTSNVYRTVGGKGLSAREELKQIEAVLGIKNAP